MYYTAKSQAILQRRKQLGLTQKELAKVAGLGDVAIYRMEKQLYKVHPLRAKAVAEVLGCKVEDLFEVESVKEVS